MNTVSKTSEFKWKTLVENYEGFQNELDNASHGIDLLKELFIDFQKFEVKAYPVLDQASAGRHHICRPRPRNYLGDVRRRGPSRPAEPWC